MSAEHFNELDEQTIGDQTIILRVDDPRLRNVLIASAIAVAAGVTVIAGYFAWQWYTAYRVVSAATQFAEGVVQ